MATDPFEQFERSRSGFLIPVALFVVGAVLTWAAISSLNDLVLDADETAAAIEADTAERESVLEALKETLDEANLDPAELAPVESSSK